MNLKTSLALLTVINILENESALSVQIKPEFDSEQSNTSQTTPPHVSTPKVTELKTEEKPTPTVSPTPSLPTSNTMNAEQHIKDEPGVPGNTLQQSASIKSAKEEEAQNSQPQPAQQKMIFGRTQEKMAHNINTEVKRGLQSFTNFLETGKWEHDKKRAKREQKKSKK